MQANAPGFQCHPESLRCCPGTRVEEPAQYRQPDRPGMKVQCFSLLPAAMDKTAPSPDQPRECWMTSARPRYSPLSTWSAARCTWFYSLQHRALKCCTPPCSAPSDLLQSSARSAPRSTTLLSGAPRCNRYPALPECCVSRRPSSFQFLSTALARAAPLESSDHTGSAHPDNACKRRNASSSIPAESSFA